MDHVNPVVSPVADTVTTLDDCAAVSEIVAEVSVTVGAEFVIATVNSVF